MALSQRVGEYIREKHYRQVNSVLIQQDNKILVESYYNGFNEKSRNVIRSVAKSILAIAAGICLDKKLIESLEEPIYHYLPAFAQGLDPFHRAITIQHLLTMTSGIYWVGGVHYHCPQLTGLHHSKDWIEHIADTAVTSVPGTKYNYKEWDVMLLTAVLQKAIAGDFFDFLNTFLFEPLQIQSGRWWKSKCGVYYSVAYGGAGNGGLEEQPSNLTAREMLHIGELFLNKGIYGGKQIVSEDYIQQAISPSRCQPSYGYLWWLRKDGYGCKGFGGQNITVLPKKKIVAVIQATPTARGMEYEDVLDYVLTLI